MAGPEYKNAAEAGSLRVLLVSRRLSKQSGASTIPRVESVLGFDLRSNSATMNSGKKALLLPSVSAESELSGAMSLLIVVYLLFTSGEDDRLAGV